MFSPSLRMRLSGHHKSLAPAKAVCREFWNPPSIGIYMWCMINIMSPYTYISIYTCELPLSVGACDYWCCEVVDTLSKLAHGEPMLSPCTQQVAEVTCPSNLHWKCRVGPRFSVDQAHSTWSMYVSTDSGVTWTCCSLTTIPAWMRIDDVRVEVSVCRPFRWSKIEFVAFVSYIFKHTSNWPGQFRVEEE